MSNGTRQQNRICFGYNTATGEYGDMIEMGILDPTDVGE